MNILKSVFFGILLAAAACVLLFWAEGRAVKTARALAEGSGLVIEVGADKIDPANEGKLVHISGAVTPQDVPADKRLGITAPAAVQLTRRVEMLQWKEVSREVERTANDGSKSKSTVYDYEQQWADSEIDSSRFKTASAPKNPAMPMAGEDFTISEAKVGAFRLLGKDIARLASATPLPLTEDGIASAALAVGGVRPVWLIDNRYVVGNDPERPQIGDLRISYARGDLDRLSAVGAQMGERLGRYTTSNGRELFLIESGAATAQEMFKEAIAGNTALTWVLRVLGLVLMFVGFTLTFRLLTGLSDMIPFIGGLIRAGTALVSFAMTLALGSLVIAAGWVFYRPLLALAIAAVGIGAAVAMGVLGNKKVQAAALSRP